jgi:hypothetical protein
MNEAQAVVAAEAAKQEEAAAAAKERRQAKKSGRAASPEPQPQPQPEPQADDAKTKDKKKEKKKDQKKDKKKDKKAPETEGTASQPERRPIPQPEPEPEPEPQSRSSAATRPRAAAPARSAPRRRESAARSDTSPGATRLPLPDYGVRTVLAVCEDVLLLREGSTISSVHVSFTEGLDQLIGAVKQRMPLRPGLAMALWHDRFGDGAHLLASTRERDPSILNPCFTRALAHNRPCMSVRCRGAV